MTTLATTEVLAGIDPENAGNRHGLEYHGLEQHEGIGHGLLQDRLFHWPALGGKRDQSPEGAGQANSRFKDRRSRFSSEPGRQFSPGPLACIFLSFSVPPGATLSAHRLFLGESLQFKHLVLIQIEELEDRMAADPELVTSG